MAVYYHVYYHVYHVYLKLGSIDYDLYHHPPYISFSCTRFRVDSKWELRYLDDKRSPT